MKESLKKAQANYQKKCKVYNIRINTETEADLLAWMQEGSAATRIKKLIRDDIKARERAKSVSYELEDGAVIIEKVIPGVHPIYEYYLAGNYFFGTPEPMLKEELQQLYNNGYFDYSENHLD